MATKAELLEQAREKGLDVKTSTKKSELESMLQNSNLSDERVVVNENEDGEAKNQTTEDGQTDPVENTESIPQNGVTEIQTLGEIKNEDDREVAKRADEARTKESIEFADESNPNQKARTEAVEDAEYDQDGNLRTGGKSYGVSADDKEGTVFDEQNAGEEKEDQDEQFTGRVRSNPSHPGEFLNPVASSDNDTNNQEWSAKDQFSLEEKLSRPEDGVQARVTTSAGTYVRVKYFWNNKPLGTFKSRDFKESEANEFLDRLIDEKDVLGR